MSDPLVFAAQAVDLLKKMREGLEAAGYGANDLAAYAWIGLQRAGSRRMQAFARSLDAATGASGEQRERLYSLLESDAGQEMLGDFAEATIRSSSLVVGAALALLYADTDNAVHSLNFKRIACQALRGLTDHQIDLFIELAGEPRFRDPGRMSSDPYDMHYVSQVALANPRVNVIETDITELVLMTIDLVQRGLLAAEPSNGRLADENTLGPFGVSTRTEKFRALLLVAREQLASRSATLL